MARGTRKSQIGNLNSQVLLGAHMSIRGGVSMAIERARSIRCTATERPERVGTPPIESGWVGGDEVSILERHDSDGWKPPFR